MKAFEYAAPTTIDEAVKLLGAPGAAALSGGTDLISRMKDYVSLRNAWSISRTSRRWPESRATPRRAA